MWSFIVSVGKVGRKFGTQATKVVIVLTGDTDEKYLIYHLRSPPPSSLSDILSSHFLHSLFILLPILCPTLLLESSSFSYSLCTSIQFGTMTPNQGRPVSLKDHSPRRGNIDRGWIISVDNGLLWGPVPDLPSLIHTDRKGGVRCPRDGPDQETMTSVWVWDRQVEVRGVYFRRRGVIFPSTFTPGSTQSGHESLLQQRVIHKHWR